MKNVRIEDFKKRMPIYNKEYFDNLNVNNQEQYIKLYISYSNLLYKYLLKNVNLKEIEASLRKVKQEFTKVREDKMDIYQYLGSEYLDYLYIRNNLYIERLSEKELQYLKTKMNDDSLDKDAEKFIEITYQKVIFNGNDKKIVSINYGPDNGGFYAPNNVLVLGIRYDNSKKEEETDSEWALKSLNRRGIIKIYEDIVRDELKKSGINAAVIVYSDDSVIKLEDTIKPNFK